MNQGEENRFDGLLRNKFDNFEQDPNPKVWDAVSTKIPSTTPNRGIMAIRPFLAGLALGMVTMFGAGSAYLSLTGEEEATQRTQHTPTEQTETIVFSDQATTETSSGTAANAGSGIQNSQQENQFESESLKSRAKISAQQLSESAVIQAKTTRKKGIARLMPVVIPAPQIKFIAEPAQFGISSTGTSPRKLTETNRNSKSGSGNIGNTSSAKNTNLQQAKLGSSEDDNSWQTQVSEPTSNTPAETLVNTSGSVARPLLISNVESAWLAGLELDTTINNELRYSQEGTAKQDQIHNLLKAQATVLALLQNRNDSLVLALNQTGADSLAQRARIVRNPPAKAGGSVRPPAWPFPSKWALAIMVETTPGWGKIAHGADLTSAQENTTQSVGQQIKIMHRLNSRLSVSGGVGLTQLHSTLRFSKHIQSQDDTLINNVMVVNKETWSVDQTLRPNYNFVTVPVSLHQKFGGTGRLSIGLSAGAQVYYFNGGNMPVWASDRYQLQKVTSENSPFRSISASMHGSLDLSLRISPKINLIASPTMRWWAISPLKEAKSSYGLIPGVQVGMIWDL